MSFCQTSCPKPRVLSQGRVLRSLVERDWSLQRASGSDAPARRTVYWIAAPRHDPCPQARHLRPLGLGRRPRSWFDKFLSWRTARSKQLKQICSLWSPESPRRPARSLSERCVNFRASTLNGLLRRTSNGWWIGCGSWWVRCCQPCGFWQPGIVLPIP